MMLRTWLLLAPLACWAFKDPWRNDFDICNSIVPAGQIVRGGPPRDGIPAIDQPRFITVSQAAFMEDSDLVIGVELNGIARAYPTRIMLWHEIANDQLGELPVAVTYCPLCGTAMVFDRTIEGAILSFGVSGLLYQSDVLMYDRQSESLWSQLMMKAISGPRVSQSLRWLPSSISSWTAWKKQHPNGQVLSTETGFARDYNLNPYGNYEQSQQIWFGVPIYRQEFANKTWVLGVIRNGVAKAYPVDTLPPNQRVIDSVGGDLLEVEYDPLSRQPDVRHLSTGENVPFVMSFWFAWQAFYPKTEIWPQFRLELVRPSHLRLFGELGKTYVLEQSRDLKLWAPIHTLTNLEGYVELSDVPAIGDKLFYRAKLAP